MDNDDPVVLVGEISAPFGVRGQVKMRPLMEKPETLAGLPAVTLRLRGAAREEIRRRILTARLHKTQTVLLSVEGVDSIEAADPLRGAEVLIRRSELPPLEPDAYYEDDLVGLSVVTESGRDLGVIEKVLFYPANDVYETPVALIPAVESVVVSVDVAAGRVLVRDMVGLRKDE